MILKSVLREAVEEVLNDHGMDNADFADDLVDRLCAVCEVMDDDDAGTVGE